MKPFASFGDPVSPPGAAVAVDTPKGCPVCASSSIVTTAKTPDAYSYWRCTSCGEVWNASRRQIPRGWRR